MRWSWTCALLLCWLTWLPDSVATGQIVRVGPGGSVRVRAPFVRVYVAPDGRTSVRAPFTDVNAPGRRYVAHPPHSEILIPDGASVAHGQQPTLADPALADWAALWRMLDSGTIRLDEQLGQSAKASSWKGYLQTSRLRETGAEQGARAPDLQTVNQLREILAQYEQTIATQHYQSVSSLSGFRMVYIVLKELISPPLQRDRRRLEKSATNLERELLRLDDGRRWARHLQLPEEVFVGRSDSQQQVPSPPGTGPSREPELGRLVDVLKRFDAISHDPKYGVIARMPAFPTTHKRLGNYVRLLSASQSDDPPLPPQVEALPVPHPEPR